MKKDKQEIKDIKALEAKVTELEELVSQLQAEKDETFEKLQRVSADYLNYQKRAPKQIADSVTYEKERFVKSLLGAIDNFEHALGNSEKAEDLKSFVHGIEIVHNEILSTFKSLGVEKIDAVGEIFDPSQHEALMQRNDDEKANGEVLEEFQKGYKLNNKVIRPAKVEQPMEAVEEVDEDEAAGDDEIADGQEQ